MYFHVVSQIFPSAVQWILEERGVKGVEQYKIEMHMGQTFSFRLDNHQRR